MSTSAPSSNGQYAYGAALALGLVVIGIAAALVLWRFFDMQRAAPESRGSRSREHAPPCRSPTPGRLGARSPPGRGSAAVPSTGLLYGFHGARRAADPRALSLAGHRRLLRPDRRQHLRSLAHARGRSCRRSSRLVVLRLAHRCPRQRRRGLPADRRPSPRCPRRADRPLSAPRQLALPLEPGHRRHAEGRIRASARKFPSVWTAFGNSLLLALTQMALVVAVGTLAGYYLSRFDFSRPGGVPARACSSSTPSRR